MTTNTAATPMAIGTSGGRDSSVEPDVPPNDGNGFGDPATVNIVLPIADKSLQAADLLASLHVQRTG